jgi:hypothetical protein
MRITTQLLVVVLFLAGLSSVTVAGQDGWYYHVKSGGTGGKPVPSDADPGLSSCWNSINAAFAAVKSRATPGPWIIQVDDEATYDEAVVLTGLQTSSTETFTLTKAPWLAGRPTIYPHQPVWSVLGIHGLWPATREGRLIGGLTYVTVRGFTFRSNMAATDQTAKYFLFTDNQTYMTEGLHIIEDCIFDGQNQVYDKGHPIGIWGTCINTVFRRNVVQNFTVQTNNMGVVFVMTKPVADVVGQPQVIIADNTFYGNKGLVAEFAGDTDNQRCYKLVIERNKLIRNSCGRHRVMSINFNALCNIVQNNIFADNSGAYNTLSIYNSGNTKIYHNTFFNNHMNPEVTVWGGSTSGVEVKNNIFWPTPGCHCINVGRGCTENLISANNAFFSDLDKDGYPSGSAFSTTEDTEVVGSWNGSDVTIHSWTNQSKNNTGNGYTLGGLGLNLHMHLVAGSRCIDRGASGLVSDDFDGAQRPVGAGYDIGAVEYGTTVPPRSLGRPKQAEPRSSSSPAVNPAVPLPQPQGR